MVVSQIQLDDFRRWAAKSFDNGHERVRIFSEFAVHRGGRSMLDVQLRGIALLLASPVPWEYYINLSDTHYPADAPTWFASYLWLHRGSNYARITSTKYYDPTLQGGRHATYSGPRSEDVYIACDRSLAFECEGQLHSLTPGEKFPPLWSGITAASGPEWVVLSRSFVEYVHRGLAEPEANLVSRLYDDLASLSIPEETFFQTLLLTSPFCHTVLRHEFLYLDLYDAPWRTSPGSDFPFQSPRHLNATHLPDIATEEPWFVRKIDAEKPGSVALRASLEASIARRNRVRWLTGRIPRPLSRALGAELEGVEFEQLVTVSARPTPKRMRVWLKGLCMGGPQRAALRGATASGALLLTERAAVAQRAGLARGFLPPVVALRIGCGWDEGTYRFHGEVSLIDATHCPIVSLISYLNNVGFEGEVAIHWFLEGQLQRQSGGKIPKGFSMFVDNLKDPAPGKWSVRLIDATLGHRTVCLK
ncbi:Xylt2 [Symbiodinium natans]|uniref:protein xylosyltransferase n=1 Tax=Symbiodinium natans TaxID=878477 RepID=A0A812SHU4_9DINO|nr:Xylt2 [Symbiodinium natans]